MNTTKYITNDLWEHVENQTTKVAKKVQDYLNEDNISIVLDGTTFWYELTTSYTTLPNYIYNYIKKWGNKQGYTYLYDLPTIK